MRAHIICILHDVYFVEVGSKVTFKSPKLESETFETRSADSVLQVEYLAPGTEVNKILYFIS